MIAAALGPAQCGQANLHEIGERLDWTLRLLAQPPTQKLEELAAASH
jgi:hypothetical protein